MIFFFIFQVDWYFQKWNKVVWWEEMMVNSRGEVYILALPAPSLNLQQEQWKHTDRNCINADHSLIFSFDALTAL